MDYLEDTDNDIMRLNNKIKISNFIINKINDNISPNEFILNCFNLDTRTEEYTTFVNYITNNCCIFGYNRIQTYLSIELKLNQLKEDIIEFHVNCIIKFNKRIEELNYFKNINIDSFNVIMNTVDDVEKELLAKINKINEDNIEASNIIIKTNEDVVKLLLDKIKKLEDDNNEILISLLLIIVYLLL
jgi:hypothetical protein